MNKNSPKPPVKREATFLESDEDIMAAVAARLAAVSAPPTAAPVVQAKPAPPANPVKQTPDWTAPVADKDNHQPQPFRPTHRPPIAILCVFDDVGEEGAWHRIYADRFVIGRTEGDLKIPHDGMMSSKHAELTRQQNRESWRWILNDLGSTNGTYVRIGSGILRHEQEFMIGRTRYRFDAARGDNTVDEETPSRGSTISWKASGALTLIPSLVELTSMGEGKRLPITTQEIWLGRDKSCQVVPTEDPFVSPRHARIYRDLKGRWFIDNNRSLNGVWIRVEQMPLEGNCQFLLGEQRFKLQTTSV